MSKVCEICETRPIMSRQAKQEHGVDFPYCVPCLMLSEWENMHSDYGHKEKSKTVVPQGDNEQGHRVEGCWICFPELDETQVEYTPREGTTREGIVLTVPARLAAKAKAEVVAGLLKVKATSIRRSHGFMVLSAKVGEVEVKLLWDAQARFYAAGSSVGGRKVRNVSEALRVLNS